MNWTSISLSLNLLYLIGVMILLICQLFYLQSPFNTAFSITYILYANVKEKLILTSAIIAKSSSWVTGPVLGFKSMADLISSGAAHSTTFDDLCDLPNTTLSTNKSTARRMKSSCLDLSGRLWNRLSLTSSPATIKFESAGMFAIYYCTVGFTGSDICVRFILFMLDGDKMAVAFGRSH